MGWTASIACGPAAPTRGGPAVTDAEPASPTRRNRGPAAPARSGGRRRRRGGPRPGRRRSRAAGGSAAASRTRALTTARLGLPTGGDHRRRRARRRRATEIDLLREAGVDVRLVPLEHGPVFVNIERPEGRHQLVRGALRPAARRGGAGRLARRPGLDPRPGRGRAARRPGPTFRQTTRSSALGWQGLLRELVPGEPTRHVAPHARPDRPAGEPRRPVARRRRPGHGRSPTSTPCSTAGRRWR